MKAKAIFIEVAMIFRVVRQVQTASFTGLDDLAGGSAVVGSIQSASVNTAFI
jgi:hypothetical protein